MKRLGGWWRLWIFSCGLWLIFVAVLGFSTWPNHRPMMSPDDLLKLPPEARPLLYSPPTKASGWDALAEAANVPGAGKSWKDDPVVFQAPEGDEHLLIPSTTPAQLVTFKADYTRIQSAKLRGERAVFLAGLLLVWVVPCLLVLALGLSVRWVFRGFRKEPGAGPVSTEGA